MDEGTDDDNYGQGKNAQNSETEQDSTEPYAYIHIPPVKTGGKYERIIVPVSALRKFNYTEYLHNHKIYKDKQFSYKDEEGNKIKCFILFAADNLTSVEEKIKSGKRFGIPTARKSDVNNDTLNTSADISVNLEQVCHQSKKRAKLARKESKEVKLQTSKENSNQILQKYLQTVTADDNINANSSRVQDILQNNQRTDGHSSILFEPPIDENIEDFTVEQSNATRTVLGTLRCTNFNSSSVNRQSDKQYDHSKCTSAINALKEQINYFKMKYQQAQNEALEWKYKYDNILQQNPEASCQTDSALMDYYDKLYKYDGPLNFNDDCDCVKLLRDVECATVAYKDAFKSSRPIHVVRKLMFGVYGYDDLLNRCQRSNNKPDSNLQPLDKHKNEAIERELYRYLRLNCYNVHLIKRELQAIDGYYHNAISCAKLKNKRQGNVEEALRQLEHQAEEAERVLEECNL